MNLKESSETTALSKSRARPRLRPQQTTTPWKSRVRCRASFENTCGLRPANAASNVQTWNLAAHRHHPYLIPQQMRQQSHINNIHTAHSRARSLGRAEGRYQREERKNKREYIVLHRTLGAPAQSRCESRRTKWFGPRELPKTEQGREQREARTERRGNREGSEPREQGAEEREKRAET